MVGKEVGNEGPDGLTFCPHRGKSLQEKGEIRAPPQQQRERRYGPDPRDAPSGGFAVLGFFFPLIGLILYLVWKDELPQRAHSCGKGALVGVVVYVVVWILAMIAMCGIVNAAMSLPVIAAA